MRTVYVTPDYGEAYTVARFLGMAGCSLVLTAPVEGFGWEVGVPDSDAMWASGCLAMAGLVEPPLPLLN